MSHSFVALPSPAPAQPTALPAAADEAIPLLLERYGGTLYQLGLRICGGHEEAQDMIQETFLNAYRHWDQFRGEASPKTWLYSIASRVCQRRKRLRAGQPKEMASIEDLLPGQDDAVPDVWTDDWDPFANAMSRETQEIVSRALEELPLDFRMPLVLKEIADMSLDEIAEMLDVKPATVKTRVHRARLRLRQQLAEQLPRRDNACVRNQQICLDLVHAKQDALDRGVDADVPDDLICDRCEALFATLDLTQEACRAIGRGELPAEVRAQVLGQFG